MSRKNVEAIYPLSETQQGMLFETLRAAGSGVHIEQWNCALHGNLDRSAFDRAWQRVVDRHSILRTGFVWKEQKHPLQIVLRQVTVPIEQQDWRELSILEQQVQLGAYLNADRTRGFDFTKPPLMRLALFQLSEDQYRLIWTYHHSLMDGWCVPIVLKEFLSFYRAFSQGHDLQLAPSRRYEDYIVWLRQQDLAQAEEFWTQTLQGFTKPTPLGTIAPAENWSESEVGYGEQIIYLSAAATTTLQSLLRQHHLTLNTLIQGVWALLLNCYSGETDVIFGSTVSGRPTDLLGIESMIGLFINTLPVRVKVAPKTPFWQWLEDIQNDNFDLRQYEYSPGGRVHQCSEVPGVLPLYESILVVENHPLDLSILQSSELKIDLSQVSYKGAQTNYAITLLVIPDSRLKLQLNFDRKRLQPTSSHQILQHFITLLESIAANPTQTLADLLTQIPTDQIPQVRSPQPCRRKSNQPLTAPRTATETTLAEIWAQVLGIEQLGIHDNFFELGGHSLLATQVMSRVRATFELELPLRNLFEQPTIAGLAEAIDTVNSAETNPKAPPILPVPRQQDLPLSFGQQRLWFLDQLEPGNSIYNVPAAIRLVGPLNLVALEQSFNEIIRRHEVLRTTFTTSNGEPRQVIAPSLHLTVSVVDLQEMQLTEPELQQLATQEFEKPFDLTQAPLLRATLLQLSQTERILLFTMHHIVSDGWSVGVLIKELASFYTAFSAGKATSLPELSIQYVDFAVWQQQWLQGEVLESQLAYWKQQLDGTLPVLQLPYDRPPSPTQTSAGKKRSFTLSKSLTDAVKALCQRQDVTLFMLLLATFNTLLHAYSKQEDILVGSPVANRNRMEIEELIGFFLNTLVMRTDLSGNPSFQELLHRTREAALRAYAHQDLPFKHLVETLLSQRDPGHTPFFQVWFAFQNAPMPPLELAGLTLSPLDIENSSVPFNLALLMWETPEGLTGTFEYHTDLFEASTIARLIQHFERLLQQVVEQPDLKLSQMAEMLAEVDRAQQTLKAKEFATADLKMLKNIKRKATSITR